MRISDRSKLQRTVIAFEITLVLLSLHVTPASALTSSTVRTQIEQAYSSLLNAESNGGNVTALTASLNDAILLVQSADSINGTNPTGAQTMYAEASSIAGQVIQSAPAVTIAGQNGARDSLLALGAETTTLAILAVITYVYTPRVFWSLWLRAHRNWRVRKP